MLTTYFSVGQNPQIIKNMSTHVQKDLSKARDVKTNFYEATGVKAAALVHFRLPFEQLYGMTMAIKLTIKLILFLILINYFCIILYFCLSDGMCNFLY